MMAADWLKGVEPMVRESRIKVPYSWSVGDTGSRFLTEMRDNGKLLGKRCEACETVFVPPRKMCPRCFQDTGPWIEVGPQGRLAAFTVARYDTGLAPKTAPVAYGIIELDGATTGLVHLLDEVAPEALVPGMRMEPVFREDRVGHILDIAHFRPVNG